MGSGVCVFWFIFPLFLALPNIFLLYCWQGQESQSLFSGWELQPWTTQSRNQSKSGPEHVVCVFSRLLRNYRYLGVKRTYLMALLSISALRIVTRRSVPSSPLTQSAFKKGYEKHIWMDAQTFSFLMNATWEPSQTCSRKTSEAQKHEPGLNEGTERETALHWGHVHWGWHINRKSTI